jgi:hypothetical protein
MAPWRKWDATSEMLRRLARATVDLWREDSSDPTRAWERGRTNWRDYLAPENEDQIEWRHDHPNNPLRTPARREWVLRYIRAWLHKDAEVARWDRETAEKALLYYWDVDHASVLAARSVAAWEPEEKDPVEATREEFEGYVALFGTITTADEQMSARIAQTIEAKRSAGAPERDLDQLNQRLQRVRAGVVDAMRERAKEQAAKR